MFYLTFDFNSDGIFVFPRVDLHNKILISSQNSDLEKSASSTWGQNFRGLAGGRGECYQAQNQYVTFQ